MNKKWILGSLVGGLIVFLWQFLSWTALNLHSPNQKYTDKQNEILQCISQNITEDGTYLLPNLPPNASSDEQQAFMESVIGKPWGMVSYRKSNEMSMGMNMFRGFTADVLAVFLLCWLFSFIPSIETKKAMMICTVIGLVGYLTTEYSIDIWFKTNSIPDLIDAIVPWSLCGAWLGYWLKK